jgi:micrococcal nuclease
MKKILPIILLAFIIPQIAFAAWWNPFTWKIFQKQTVPVEKVSTTKPAPTVSEVSNSTDSKNKNESSTPSISKDTYSVVKVLDGDTIDVSIDGKTERLRLIGIDTPETVDPRKPVQCFGIEASNKAKDMLAGKKVSLESDSTQGERDKYDRLLRYVFLEDGTNFNLMMIKEGYAHEYTFGVPYKYQSAFKQAQKDAEARNKGLWDSEACEKKPTPTPAIAPTPIKLIPKQEETSSQCHPSYSGCLNPNASDYDCSGGKGDGPYYTGAVQVIGPDVFRLDRDGDGWACE